MAFAARCIYGEFHYGYRHVCNQSHFMMKKYKLIETSFQHLAGLGRGREKLLYNSKIYCWDDYLNHHNRQLALFNNLASRIEHDLLVSQEQFEARNANYIAATLPKTERYKIASSFPERTMFLDIETTGLSKYYDEITLIGWSLNNKFSVLKQGDDISTFRDALSKAKAVVTFNGAIFDIPFILHEYPDLKFPICHIDLRFAIRRTGTSGGQKIVEDILGFKRPESVKDIKGKDAPLLWFKYQLGDKAALEKLIYYNFLDIEGMKFLYDHFLRFMISQLPIPEEIIDYNFFFKGSNSLDKDPSKFCK